MSTPEIQFHIDSLPHDLVKASENFHIKCMQHLARAQAKGKRGWDHPDTDVESLKNALNEAANEGDWTSVSNYAMMINHRSGK